MSIEAPFAPLTGGSLSYFVQDFFRGYGEQAKAHLAKINGWSSGQTEAYFSPVWKTWHQRSCHDWRLNLSWLQENYSININPKR